ncbi:hypothetical protein [Streptomyces sp. CA-251251]|uniref:hypothetical protein n=1 Tax=Streptomyces sp. CA-251251 TaxID=3240063 RepID=UPI003D900BCF
MDQSIPFARSQRAIEHRDAATGEDFNVVAPTALNVRGFAHIAAGWFGQTPSLETVPWDQFGRTSTPAESTADHPGLGGSAMRL